MFTREQVEKIDIGTKLKWGMGTGTFSGPYEVVEITCRRDDIHGHLFVHGYFQWHEGSRMSFSIKEQRTLDATLYQIVE